MINIASQKSSCHFFKLETNDKYSFVSSNKKLLIAMSQERL